MIKIGKCAATPCAPCSDAVGCPVVWYTEHMWLDANNQCYTQWTFAIDIPSTWTVISMVFYPAGLAGAALGVQTTTLITGDWTTKAVWLQNQKIGFSGPRAYATWQFNAAYHPNNVFDETLPVLVVDFRVPTDNPALAPRHYTFTASSDRSAPTCSCLAASTFNGTTRQGTGTFIISDSLLNAWLTYYDDVIIRDLADGRPDAFGDKIYQSSSLLDVHNIADALGYHYIGLRDCLSAAGGGVYGDQEPVVAWSSVQDSLDMLRIRSDLAAINATRLKLGLPEWVSPLNTDLVIVETVRAAPVGKSTIEWTYDSITGWSFFKDPKPGGPPALNPVAPSLPSNWLDLEFTTTSSARGYLKDAYPSLPHPSYVAYPYPCYYWIKTSNPSTVVVNVYFTVTATKVRGSSTVSFTMTSRLDKDLVVVVGYCTGQSAGGSSGTNYEPYNQINRLDTTPPPPDTLTPRTRPGWFTAWPTGYFVDENVVFSYSGPEYIGVDISRGGSGWLDIDDCCAYVFTSVIRPRLRVQLAAPTSYGQSATEDRVTVRRGEIEILTDLELGFDKQIQFYEELTHYLIEYDGQGGYNAPHDNAWYLWNSDAIILDGTPYPMSKDGYTFRGWRCGEEIYQPGDVFKVKAAWTQLKARWCANSYIFFDDAGSTAGILPGSYLKIECTARLMPYNSDGLEKLGWTFSGWNTAPDGTGTTYGVGASFDTDAIARLYAKWTKSTMTPSTGFAVTYHRNDTEVGLAPPYQRKEVDVPLTLRSNTYGLARQGCTFGGWNTAADGTGTNYAEGASYTANADVQLYANWVATKYTISFVLGDAVSGTLPDPITKIEGVPAIIPFASPDAYRPAGTSNTDPMNWVGGYYVVSNYWKNAVTGQTITVGSQYTDEADLVLAPYMYTRNYATVGFSYGFLPGVGITPDGPLPPTPQYFADGTVFVLPTSTMTYTIPGSPDVVYVFAEWDTGNTVPYTIYPPGTKYSLQGSITTYFSAKWRKQDGSDIVATVAYLNTGADSGSSVPPFSVTSTTHRMPGNFAGLAKAGYAFGGWQKDGTGTVYTAGVVVGLTAFSPNTFVPYWSLQTYTTSFDANGVAATYPPVVATVVASFTLPALPTRSGYTSPGWNTAADGTGTTYAAGSSYAPTATRTLYVKWVAVPYAVTYSANGATAGAAPATQTKLGSDDFISLAYNTGNLVRTDFVLDGWNTLSNGTGINYWFGQNYVANAALALFAKWKAIVTYNANGATAGTVPPPQTRVGDNTFMLLAYNTGNLVKTGFVIAGWNTAADGSGTTYTFGQSYAANVPLTLFAKWSPV